MAAVLERLADDFRGVHIVAGVLDELRPQPRPYTLAEQARD